MKIKTRIHNADLNGLNCLNCEALVERLLSARRAFERSVPEPTCPGVESSCLQAVDAVDKARGLAVVEEILETISDPEAFSAHSGSRKYAGLLRGFIDDPDVLMHFSDFIIIGGARCGSSWLRWSLGQNPNILMLRGEPRFLSAHFDAPALPNLEKYLPIRFNFSHPEQFSPVFYKYCTMGEKNPDYHTMSPAGMLLLEHLFPQAKFVLLTRDPVERMWSHLKHQFRQGTGLEGFLKGDQGRSPAAGGDKWQWIVHSLGEGLFTQSIRRWVTAFGASRILVIRYEDLSEDAAAVLSRVCRYLGVSFPPDWSAARNAGVRRNTSDVIAMPEFLREYLEEAYREERLALKALSPGAH